MCCRIFRNSSKGRTITPIGPIHRATKNADCFLAHYSFIFRNTTHDALAKTGDMEIQQTRPNRLA